MRQSVVPNRLSHAVPGTSQSNAASMTRLLEKKKEYEAVAALERASALFVKRMEGLGDDCELMADAGLVHGQVLEQWPQMFRILDLFLSQRKNMESPGDLDSEQTSLAAGERLVRIPIDDAQDDPKSA
ncbi:hypothetical protein CONPUDRAFT_100864, partial [Coniophora puteana RWD-64-598 SS2]